MDNMVQEYTFLIGSRDTFKTSEELIRLWMAGEAGEEASTWPVGLTSEEIRECSHPERYAWLCGCLKAKSEGWVLGPSVMALIRSKPGPMRICGAT
jgi:hypothetical protein